MNRLCERSLSFDEGWSSKNMQLVFATNDLDMCWIIFVYNDNKGSAGSRERVWEDMLTLGEAAA